MQTKLMLFICCLLSSTILPSCNKKGESAPGNTPQKGYATGRVTDTQGRPLSGAKILLDNTILYASYIHGVSDVEGRFKMKVPYGVYIAYAYISREYHGKTYTMELEPDTNEGFTDEGAVRNFVWKLEGRMRGDAYRFHGGFIEVSTDIGFPHELAQVELVFTPVGPLIDGSAGKTIRMRSGDNYWVRSYEIEGVPIGRYRVNAVWKTTGGDRPLRIQNRATQGSFETDFILDFIPEPQFTAVKNAASIVIGL